MGRFCYCSRILPGKSDLIRSHWKNKKDHEDEEKRSFLSSMGLTGFEAWLQKTALRDYMIHCLEGASLEEIFAGLRKEIAVKNKFALQLHSFYLEVLGKDYSEASVEPKIESISHISVSERPQGFIKKAFFYPLLPEKEKEHREFRRALMNEKRERYLASIKPFHVYNLSIWLQHSKDGKYLVIYSERKDFKDRLQENNTTQEWKEIASTLMDHTGLSYDELGPQVEWLTRK